MLSPRTGKPIANQFIIDCRDYDLFQSYNSIIVKKGIHGVQLDETYWNYSRTTSKYRNEFLGEDTKTIKSKIASGEYEVTNLN